MQSSRTNVERTRHQHRNESGESLENQRTDSVESQQTTELQSPKMETE